jgi:NADH-quinone oxidoreductase subunit E
LTIEHRAAPAPVAGHAAALATLDAEAGKILAKYDEKRAATLTLLHLAQDKVGYVSQEVEAWVSKWTDVPVVRVHAVATFYSMYHKAPAGRTHIRFCTSTSCMLAGCEKLLAHLKAKLGIDNGQTTPDGRVSLEEAECLCACEGAPMMQVGDDYHVDLDEKKIDRIVDGLQ